LPADGAEQKDDRTLVFEHALDRVRHPLEYRITAGSGVTPTYRVEVLYPLKIAKIQATMQAPEYTGLKEQVAEGGNITGLAGTQVKLDIELDRAAQEAWLQFEDLRRSPEGPPITKLPLTIDGKNLSANFELAKDQKMMVIAKAADGMELPENLFRVRVRKDEAPQVWFDSPAEALEVHSLVELLMRIRVSDDFGLSRAGIMFEVNNEEEYPLLAQDFQAAAVELNETGKLSPQTRATLEKMLPLEHFQLTAQDSVMYYAFAEDNLPGNPQRTETDLRFVDIRPFRRVYRLQDADGEMTEGNRPQLKSLDELIARQRYALNRTMRLEKLFKHTGEADLAGTDAMIKFEGELAKFTRELAEGLEARGVDPSDTELLYQAETSMLGATDSLSAGNYETAVLQERDAVKYLIEGRIKIEQTISKNPNRQQLAQLRSFDRTQRQKLRKPKTDEEEAKEIARRLEQLAQEEDFVYKTLAGIPADGSSKGETDSPEGTQSNEQPMKPNEKGEKGDMPPRDKANEGEKAKDGDKGQDAEKGEKGKVAENGDKGQEAEKGKNGEDAKGERGQKSQGEKGDQPGSGQGQAPSRQELEDKQLDVAVEAREIEKVLNRLNGVTDLTKERIAAAAKTAEEAGTALGQGNMKDAENAAKSAGGQFQELKDQVKALLAQEQADRVAAAQQMAADLSRQQQNFVDRLANKSEQQGGVGEPMPKKDDDNQKPGSTEGKKPNEDQRGLGGQAERIAEKAKTLADVLGAAAGADNPEDQPSAEKVKQLTGTLGLPDLTQRLQQLPDQVAGGKIEEAKANAGDGAERMEAAAQALAALHRAIVAPKVDELAKAEEKLTQLDEELDTLETPTAITGWHVDAAALLDELDKLGISKELRDQLLEEMKKAGWAPDVARSGWRWNRVEGGYYVAPIGYRSLLSRLSSDVRTRMQELMLGDLAFSRDEPIPPQYQELVDRYYQVLAAEGKEQPKRPAVTPQK
jgi:hypothetical protein